MTITTRSIPARRSVRITLGVSGRIGSSSTSAPAISPSIWIITHDDPSIALRRRTSRAAAGNGSPWAIHEALPSATLWSSTVPRIPEPGSSLTSFGNDSSSPR